MAFITALPVGNKSPPAALCSSFVCNHAISHHSSTTTNAPRMGYGKYSYITDKTKGHVNQYYVDKFRTIADFSKGIPASMADAMVGRDQKGRVKVPAEGIPQPLDPALPPRVEDVAPDPRIAEAEGVLYPWDPNYVNPEFAPESFGNTEDSEIVEDAFQKFRSSIAEERTSALTAMDFGAVARKQRIKAGLDEKYLLCLDGALDATYARLQNIADPMVFSPYGEPQTEIPGMPFTPSVGAMDFQTTPGEEINFWATEKAISPQYKKPSGADTPELPYNVSPTVDEMKEAQKARGIIP
eukprot:TRINITY_DN504_c0_g2_i1.p1 TRINITY_DN504_c0_g2~~TRINITY_DN504_c0_g2_i1.p1  ORF type:complete len:336 (-),score=46.19 TRINITY_DN504_c0_g2_i1:2075-2965(-)